MYSRKQRRGWINSNNGEVIERRDCHTEHAEMIEKLISDEIVPISKYDDNSMFYKCTVHQALQLGYIRFFANKENAMIVGAPEMVRNGIDTCDTHIAFEATPTLFAYCQDWLMKSKLKYEIVYFNNGKYTMEEFLLAKRPRKGRHEVR